MSHRPESRTRRQLLLSLALPLSGCLMGAPTPPPNYYRLPLATPEPVGHKPPAAATGLWQLLLPIRLPEHLERDVLWLPSGAAGLLAMEGHRWAEPLREALPRLLTHDLSQLRGADKIWLGALPPGLAADRQLRLELLTLEPAADRRSVTLQARWLLLDPRGQAPLRSGQADVSAPSLGPTPDPLVAAHRLALWRLAQQLAALDA